MSSLQGQPELVAIRQNSAMKSSLKRFKSLCSQTELNQFWLLLLLGIIISLLQVVSVASILPFLELASNPDALTDNPRLRAIYQRVGFSSEKTLIVTVAWISLLCMTAANLLSVVSVWFQQKIAWNVSHTVSMRLVTTYTELPYQFFLNKDSSDLIRSAIDDINNLIDGIVLAGCTLVSQLLITGLIFLMLVIINPVVALSAVGLVGFIYLLIVLARRSFLTGLGGKSIQARSARYRTFVELISGIKTIKSNGVKKFFLDRFETPSYQYSTIQPLLQTTYTFPRYLVDSLAFGGVIFIVLYLAGTETGFVDALPMLTLFTLAGYRLIPAMHGAYVAFAQMLNSYPAIDAIYNDIQSVSGRSASDNESIQFEKNIKLSSVLFAYPEVALPAVDGVSMEISKGIKVALVGPSGSGKTTIVDLIMGLLEPTAGEILIDDVALTQERHESWRQMIGYVPQEVFLYNDTITNNIVFGIDTIDEARVRTAARMAQISEFVETQLPEQYNTVIGERGTRLSGGQKQRLGLARALYRLPSVLILDEATSALDNVTEGNVIKAIHEEIPDVTIIMIAHRISTVVRCDRLFVIDRGKIIAEGDYQTLLKEDSSFQQLARFD